MGELPTISCRSPVGLSRTRVAGLSGQETMTKMSSPREAIDSMKAVPRSGWVTPPVLGCQSASTPRPSTISMVATMSGPTAVDGALSSTQVGTSQSCLTFHATVVSPSLAYQFQKPVSSDAQLSWPWQHHSGCWALTPCPPAITRASEGSSSEQTTTSELSQDMLGCAHWNQASLPSWTRGPA